MLEPKAKVGAFVFDQSIPELIDLHISLPEIIATNLVPSALEATLLHPFDGALVKDQVIPESFDMYIFKELTVTNLVPSALEAMLEKLKEGADVFTNGTWEI